MNMKTTFTILLFIVSLQLRAQLFFDAEGSLGLNQVFGGVGLGNHFENGFSIRWMGSYGNFGKETQTGERPPYSEYTGSDYSEVTKFNSSNIGISTGLGAGYTFQVNERHSIYGEALAQMYIVTDHLDMEYVSTFGWSKGSTRSLDEIHRHRN
jgi:hypothetical protein